MTGRNPFDRADDPDELRSVVRELARALEELARVRGTVKTDQERGEWADLYDLVSLWNAAARERLAQLGGTSQAAGGVA